MKSLRNVVLICSLLAGNALLAVDPPVAKNSQQPFYPLTRQWLSHMAASGDGLAMGDGTHWKVEPAYADEMRTWEHGDPLMISPNYMPISQYVYWIKNTRKNSAVPANLFLCTEEYGKNSHWVHTADHARHIVFLENRLGFEVDFRDAEKFRQWGPNDSIIIGMSNSWFSSYNVILINVNMNHFVKAKVYLEE